MASLKMSRVLVAIISVAVVGLLVGVLVGGSVYTPDASDSRSFTTETVIQENQIVHAFAPDTEEHRDYRASFSIFQEGTEIQNVEDEDYELAADDPLVVVIEDRNPEATYQVDVTIWNADDEVVYDGTLVVSGSG